MKCPVCGGSASGCNECESGQIEITGCPLELVTEDIFELIEMSRMFYDRLPPTGTSVGDQSVMFIRAARFIRSEENFWKTKLKIIS